MEEDNDDDELLMREIDELARINNNDNDEISEGGNTSINSLMEETPSKYDFEN